MNAIKRIIFLSISLSICLILFNVISVSAVEKLTFGSYITCDNPTNYENNFEFVRNFIRGSSYDSSSTTISLIFCNGLWKPGMSGVLEGDRELSIQYRKIQGNSSEVENLDYYYKRLGNSANLLKEEVVYINDIKALHLRYNTAYYMLFSEASKLVADVYVFCTDNCFFEIKYIVEKQAEEYLDSEEYKKMINSIKVTDTVKASRGIPFKDVQTQVWYYDAVKYNYENSIINGINNYTFAPNNKVTRGMLVTMLYGMEGAPKVSGTCEFSDVSSTKYYYNAVLWAYKNNIVNGSNGKFRPDDYITRQDLAVILSAYSKYKGKYVASNYGLNKYSDATSVSSYATPAIRWAVKNGIINGSNGKLNPKGTATRAEAATMIYSYCLKFK